MNRTRFKLEIDCDKAAFVSESGSAQENAECRGHELAAILRRLADRLDRDGAHVNREFLTADSNANVCGRAKTTLRRMQP